MATSYPGALDGAPSTHGDVSDAVAAVEAELGVNPSGTAATVAARFAALTVTVGSAAPSGSTPGLLYVRT